MQAGKPALQFNPFNKKVYFANRCSSDARSDGKTKKIFQKAGIAEVTYSY